MSKFKEKHGMTDLPDWEFKDSDFDHCCSDPNAGPAIAEYANQKLNEWMDKAVMVFLDHRNFPDKPGKYWVGIDEAAGPLPSCKDWIGYVIGIRKAK